MWVFRPQYVPYLAAPRFVPLGPAPVIATGAIILGSLSAAGTGTFATTAAGAITLGALTAAGTGSFDTTGSGAVTLGALTASGTATFDTTATGAITLGSLEASGVATFDTTASGSITLGSLSAAGVGAFSAVGTGSIVLAGLSVHGVGTSAASTTQIFEQALLARLQAIPEITAIVGTAIYTSALPQTHDLGALGPALTYSVPTKPRGHDLSGADGTAAAMVQLDAWSYSESSVKALIEAIFNGFNGTPTPTSWGNGTCQIMSCVQTNELDADESPEGGNDQPVFHTISEYNVRYRTALPTLS